MGAITAGQYEAVKILIENGADRDNPNPTTGETALTIAEKIVKNRGSERIYEYLKK